MMSPKAKTLGKPRMDNVDYRQVHLRKHAVFIGRPAGSADGTTMNIGKQRFATVRSRASPEARTVPGKNRY